MSFWGNTDNGDEINPTIASQLSIGSGNANIASESESLYNNTTPDAFILNQTISIVALTVEDIVGGAPVGQPGWYIKREGAGGRSGRIQYEPLIAMRSLQEAPVLPLNSRIAFEGDSITAGSSGPTYVQFALITSGGRYYAPPGYNQATGGQTAAQMATQVANVAALNPKVVVFMAGTNDLGGTEDTPEEIFANIRTCVEAYQAAGANVVSICVLPRDDDTWNGLGTSREPDRLALNELIRAQSDVTIIDLEDSFDTDTMTVDGLHPNYTGAILIGNAVGAALSNLIVEDPITYLTDESTNILISANENPGMTGTTGTKSGTATPTGEVASKWTVSENGGMTVVASKTTLNGREAQKITVSGTNSTAGRVVNITNTVAYSGQAGEYYECLFDFILSSGSQNLRSIAASCDTATMPNSSTTSILPSDEISGVIRTPNSVNALAGSDVSTSVQCVLTFAAGAVSAELVVAAPYFGKVIW